jgi:hypothetical protein
MKTLSKLIAVALTVTAIFFTANVKAQTTAANTFNFNIGVETGIPTGNLRISSRFELGGTARLQYGVTNNFAITLTSGAFHNFGRDIPGTDLKYDSFGVIPIKAGIKEFFIPNIYFGIEAGVGLEITDSGWGQKKLDISPAVGYANKHWDIGVHYESFSGEEDKYGLVGLRIAYGFGL